MRFVIPCIIVVLSSCDTGVEPTPRPPGAVEIDPLPRWADWYAEVEDCSGIEGAFSRVEWHMVPEVGSWTSTHDGASVAGEWWPPHDIYVAEHRIDHGSEETVLTHEIGHDLIQDRDPRHEHDIWGTCAPGSL